jgi:pSer/pThr/pTyr-binding forkhead associated (FHA) protein
LAELVVLNGVNAGTVFVLADVPTVVGRSPESHLLIGDPWISSMHAMFERRGEEIWVVDLDSRNGTFVDDDRVDEAPVADGAVVRFGRTEVRLELRRSPRARKPTDPPRPPRDARGTLRADLPDAAEVTLARLPEVGAPALVSGRATVLRMTVDAAGVEALPGGSERVQRALDAVARAALEGGATVSRLAGVGVLAVFGLGGAGPEDAAHALAAALAARRDVRDLGGLDLRAAIDTGTVLAGAAGELSGVALAALGPAAESAERLLATAARGEILAGAAAAGAGFRRVGVRSVGGADVEVFRAEDG